MKTYGPMRKRCTRWKLCSCFGFAQAWRLQWEKQGLNPLSLTAV